MPISWALCTLAVACALADAGCAAPGAQASGADESEGAGRANSAEDAARVDNRDAPTDDAGTIDDPSEMRGAAQRASDPTADPGSADDGAALGAPAPWAPSFETRTLSTDFVAEGAAIADLDGDGALDLVAGAIWYAGPDFALEHQIDQAPVVDVTAYSLYFLTFVDDLNADGAPDVLSIGDAGGNSGSGIPNAWWYENPGPDKVTENWVKHALFDGLVSNESPVYLDLLGDSRKELVFMSDQRLGWAAPGIDPTQPWVFNAISGSLFSTPYVHGLGVGDIDSDGLSDVLEASGWWRQLPDGAGWQKNPVDFAQGVEFGIVGGAQMFAFDVDGDADTDVVSSLSGHGYGLSWFEQTTGGFAAHAILPPSEAAGNVSQLHALQVADLNGDGLLDIVTGKRYFAHSSGDPGVDAGALLYWFELHRSEAGAEFEPHLVHDDSGVGCGFSIADVDGNARPDIFTSSKKGTFLHRQ